MAGRGSLQRPAVTSPAQSPADTRLETAAPTKFGKYDVVGVLGKGAMGIVYDCRDPVIGRRVAIKTVSKEALDSSEAETLLGRFKQEAQAAGRLNHPGVVSIYDYGETDSVAFIAMEYISGKELKKYFDEGEKFDLKEIVRIMSDILDALDHAHRNKVVHRDIKPANIMITDDGRVKVADFGVAKIESSLATQIGTRVGTPAYMAPEQHRMLSVDGRSDLFSCGVILYQFLTGARPFTGGSQTIARNILTQNPTPPSEINVTLTPIWDSIVRKALAKRPDERFQSAREFIDALRGGLGHLPGALDGLAQSPGGGTPLKTTQGQPPEAPGMVSRAAISTGSGKPERTDIAMESELEFWKEIKDSDHPEDFAAFVESFPDGRFSHLAKRRLDKLKQASSRAQEDDTLLSAGHAPARPVPDAPALKRADSEADAAHLPRDSGAERERAEQARKDAEDRARAQAEARQREEAERQARREAEERAAGEERARAQREAEEREQQRLQQEAARAAAEKAQQEAQEQARREAEARRLRDLEERARKEAEERRAKEREAKEREAKERAQKEAEAQKVAEQLRQREREAQAKREAERLRLEAEIQAKRDEQERQERQRKENDAKAAQAAKAEQELAGQQRREAQQAERETQERTRSAAQAAHAAADRVKAEAEAEAARSKREAGGKGRLDAAALNEMDATVIRSVDTKGSPAKALAEPDPDATQIRDVDATVVQYRGERIESGRQSGGTPQVGTGRIGAGAAVARRQSEDHPAVDIDLSEAAAASRAASTQDTVAYQPPGGSPLHPVQLPPMPAAKPVTAKAAGPAGVNDAPAPPAMGQSAAASQPAPAPLAVARAVTVTTREPEVEAEPKKRPALLMAGAVMAVLVAGGGWFYFASKPVPAPGASGQTAQGANPLNNQERTEAERQPKDTAPKDSAGKAASTPPKAPDTSGTAEAPSAKDAAEQRKAEQEKQNRAAEKAAEAKVAMEKAAADKLAADKLTADKLASAKSAADKAAITKLAQDKDAADKLAAAKAAADKAAADKLAAEKAAADRVAADRAAADKAAADKLAAEKGAADKAAADRAAAEKSAAERVNSANSVADRIAAASAPAELYKRAVALRGEGKTALAVALLRQASSQGHGPSSRLLAAIYKDGAADVRADFRQAERFQALADTQGDR